jgi:hypothetical protein
MQRAIRTRLSRAPVATRQTLTGAIQHTKRKMHVPSARYSEVLLFGDCRSCMRVGRVGAGDQDRSVQGRHHKGRNHHRAFRRRAQGAGRLRRQRGGPCAGAERRHGGVAIQCASRRQRRIAAGPDREDRPHRQFIAAGRALHHALRDRAASVSSGIVVARHLSAKTCFRTFVSAKTCFVLLPW